MTDLPPLPPTPEIDQLAERLANAEAAYHAHMRQQTALAAEIRSVAREAARQADPDLEYRLSALMVKREVFPEIATELAEAYARAFLAWATAKRQYLLAVDTEATEAIAETLTERQNLAQMIDRLRFGDPRREEIEVRLSELNAAAAPLHDRRKWCQTQLSGLDTYAYQLFGDARLSQIGSQHVARFVNAHRTIEIGTAA